MQSRIYLQVMKATIEQYGHRSTVISHVIG